MRALYEMIDPLFRNFKFYTENYDKVYGWLREAEIVISAAETEKLVRCVLCNTDRNSVSIST